MSELDRLLALVPPPVSPVEADADWTRAEVELGLSLPDDFKEVARCYGAGQFCDDLGICSPDQLIEYNQKLLVDWGPMRQENPAEFEFPLFPEPGGLVIWGLDSIGGALCWSTEGEPAEWKVVLWMQRDGEFQPWDCGAAGFVALQVENRVSQAADAGEAFGSAWFTPARELVYVDARLSEGSLPYADRLRILRARLAPTADRGSWAGHDGGSRQDHFVATEAEWRMTYETAYGHQIRVGYPPADADRARTEILAAIEAMGCRLLSANRDGCPVWDLPPERSRAQG